MVGFNSPSKFILVKPKKVWAICGFFEGIVIGSIVNKFSTWKIWSYLLSKIIGVKNKWQIIQRHKTILRMLC